MTMSIRVYFNRPQRPFVLADLFADLRAAQQYLLIASAWFTDTEVADAIIGAPAPHKVVILNAADLQRESVEAYARLERYFATAPRPPLTPQSGLYVLGGADWRRDGMMHHKFIVVDPGVVWVGSYNLTTFARNNYESLVRIPDPQVAADFAAEVELLLQEPPQAR